MNSNHIRVRRRPPQRTRAAAREEWPFIAFVVAVFGLIAVRGLIG